MVQQLPRAEIAAQAIIHAAPPAAASSTTVDRTFELPAGLYGTTVALYLGFVAVMMVGFGNPLLVIPLGVIVLTIIAGFVLPTIWTKLTPESGQRPKSFGRFGQDGIMTAYGRSAARDASVQVLILPVLIFCWGIAVVVIAALV
jgi:hypothetical protein